MSGGFRKTSRKSSWWASASTLLPGSVMATIVAPPLSYEWWCLRASIAASARVQASARKAFGSVVVPDFDAMIVRVVNGSRSSIVADTYAGSVESRMRSAR